MRRALLLPGLLALASCATPPPPAPKPKAPEKAHLAVDRAIHVDDSNGFLAPGSSFAVVLTRPVDPVPDALALIDQAGAPIKGTTTWLGRQLVVFYPDKKLGPGLGVVLRIAVTLRTKDGEELSPGDVDHAMMRPIKLTSSGSVERYFKPMGGVKLVFEQRLPAADVSAHGSLMLDGVEMGFTASDEPHGVVIRATTGFPPERDVRFAWKEGRVAATSVGLVALDPLVFRAQRGLDVHVGEALECGWPAGDGVPCTVGVVHVYFTASISDAEIAAHVHPPMQRATTGDARGHRFEVATTKKAMTITLDPTLTDSFGQRLGGGGRKLVIEPRR